MYKCIAILFGPTERAVCEVWYSFYLGGWGGGGGKSSCEMTWMCNNEANILLGSMGITFAKIDRSFLTSRTKREVNLVWMVIIR